MTVRKFFHSDGATTKMWLLGFLESRTPMSPLAVATSTQLLVPPLRLPFLHRALLKMSVVIMFIIVSIFFVRLDSNNGYQFSRFLRVIGEFA
jgi:hypothetical protein